MTRTKAPPVDVRQVFDRSFAIDPTKQYLVHNRTPKRIEIADRAYSVVTLAPLAARVFCGERLAPFCVRCHSLPELGGALDQKPSASRPDPPSAAAPAAGRSR